MDEGEKAKKGSLIKLFHRKGEKDEWRWKTKMDKERHQQHHPRFSFSS